MIPTLVCSLCGEVAKDDDLIRIIKGTIVHEICYQREENTAITDDKPVKWR